MRQDANYITEEKKQEFIKELEELKGPKRREILDALQYAKSLGDLKENAEYHQARDDQGSLEERIAKIEEILRTSVVVKAGGGDIVTIGSKVELQKSSGGDSRVFTIVGSEESSMAEGKISNRSPLGAAVFGKKKGEVVSVETPGGKVDYKIINVS